jgi:hypothetical protein
MSNGVELMSPGFYGSFYRVVVLANIELPRERTTAPYCASSSVVAGQGGGAPCQFLT